MIQSVIECVLYMIRHVWLSVCLIEYLCVIEFVIDLVYCYVIGCVCVSVCVCD